MILPKGKELNLEIYRAQCDPTAEVYPLLACCKMLVGSSF
jgi:hypothetical protein